MQFRTSGMIGIFLLVFGPSLSADVPIGGYYLIKVKALMGLMQRYGSIDKINLKELRAKSEFVIGQVGSFGGTLSFESKHCRFTFQTAKGNPVAAPSNNGWPFTIEYKEGRTIDTIQGDLVFTDDHLEEEAVAAIIPSDIPNTHLLINSGWKTKKFAFLIVVTNAKH